MEESRSVSTAEMGGNNDREQSRPDVCADHGTHLRDHQLPHGRQPCLQALCQRVRPLGVVQVMHGNVDRTGAGALQRQFLQPSDGPG